MIIGTDTSKYQPLGSYDPGAFEIVNVEEPDGNGGDFTATIARNVRDGRPWGVYLWVHPGRAVNVGGAVASVRGLGHGDGALGYWLDYEESGVEQWQIDDAYAQADALAIRCGLYTYLYQLPGVATRSRPLWLAYYPGNNDGTYPEGQDGAARSAGAVMWQFTSGANAPVGLDRNVVLDEQWYSEWTGGVLHGGPAPPGERVPMACLVQTETAIALVDGWVVEGLTIEQVAEHQAKGVPGPYARTDAWLARIQAGPQKAREINADSVVLAARQAVRSSPRGTTTTKDTIEGLVDNAVRAALA